MAVDVMTMLCVALSMVGHPHGSRCDGNALCGSIYGSTPPW